MMTSSGKQTLEYIVKKAARRLHFLKILKGYNAPGEDSKTFYISAIRSILEYGTKIWHGSLTEEEFKDIERIQRHGMKIICPEKTYERALIECGMETLENRREKMCIKLINDMKDLIHNLYIISLNCNKLKIITQYISYNNNIYINITTYNIYGNNNII